MSLEILEPFVTPDYLRSKWSEFPESVQGTCYIQEDIDPPQFNVTLFCEPKAVESLNHFSLFSSAPSAFSVLDLAIDFPGEREAGFWRDSWRSKELRIQSWRFISELRPKNENKI